MNFFEHGSIPVPAAADQHSCARPWWTTEACRWWQRCQCALTLVNVWELLRVRRAALLLGGRGFRVVIHRRHTLAKPTRIVWQATADDLALDGAATQQPPLVRARARPG